MRSATVLAMLVFFIPSGCASIADRAAGTPPLCSASGDSIREERFVSIRGIEQWITVTGEHCGNPVVLVLHGGPGNTLTPFADAIFQGWGEKLTLVQWDQRGAGKTFGRNRPSASEALTLEDMVADGIAVAEYAAAQLGKKKLILTGGSWGSVLAIYMIKSRPDLFHGYVGASQIVGMRRNQLASYNRVLQLAHSNGDEALVSTLEKMGPPPWTQPRNFGVLRRAIFRLEGGMTVPPPEAWWKRRADYDTPGARSDYSDGEDWSFLQFVGMSGEGFHSKIDLPRLGTDFEIPVYIIQGEKDLVTLPEITREYYEAISAPYKEFIPVAESGHDMNRPLINAQYEAIVRLSDTVSE